MTDAARAKWIASFDMEDLIGSILRSGTILSLSLVVTGIMLQRTGIAQQAVVDTIQGTNAFHLLSADLHQMGSRAFWPTLLIHWGIAVLLFTPYVRVVASVLYFACVHRSWKHMLLGLLTLAPLTYILFLG